VAEVLALCYHAVSESWRAPLCVNTDQLEAQLELILRKGYRASRFSEAVLEPPSAKTVAITFDDGFGSVYDLARPILRRLGLVGTVFVPTDFPEDPASPLRWPGIDHWVGGRHHDELRPMSWDQLAELADEGWEIGSHTKSHPHLPTLDDSALDTELAESREILEDRLGRPCETLAYPYGDHDARVIEAAERAGYVAAGTLPGRLREGGPLSWPRVGVNQLDDIRRFRLKVSPAMRLLRTTPLWPAERRGGPDA
jgi:peptidoglycan/xylan/chitin deacetylase (PgdA/CDA1 family)